MQCGYFMQITIDKIYNIKFENKSYFPKQETLINNKNPFFTIQNEDSTVKLFWDAIINKRTDDAKAFISKSFVGQFDVDDLKDCFDASNGYKNLIKAECNQATGKCKTYSILLLYTGQKSNIIHLHMIHEPDDFGKWKIYGIEKE